MDKQKYIANTLQKCIQSGKYFNNGTIDFDGIAKELLEALETYSDISPIEE
jgi:hypothetical protein